MDPNLDLFVDASHAMRKLRFAVWGPPGSGKTVKALTMAKSLRERYGGDIALIDTERGRAALCSHIVPFKMLKLTKFSPEIYMQAIEMAERAGYSILVIDSFSHAWEGKGGALDMLEAAKGMVSGNSWAAWAYVTPVHRQLVDAVTQADMHVIVTMRAKTVWEQAEVQGRRVPQKVGLGPRQRDDTEYEFDLAGLIDSNHVLHVVKAPHGSELDGNYYRCHGEQIMDDLFTWLDFVTEAAPEDAERIVAVDEWQSGISSGVEQAPKLEKVQREGPDPKVFWSLVAAAGMDRKSARTLLKDRGLAGAIGELEQFSYDESEEDSEGEGLGVDKWQ